MKNFQSERRQFLKTSSVLGVGAAVIPSFYIKGSKPKLGKDKIGHGDFQYRVHLDWGTLDSNKWPVKNCHEMVMDAQGRLIMVGDHTKNNILIYDKSGKLLDSWGIRYNSGHGLTLWNDGDQDCLFICDPRGGNKKNSQSSVIKTTTDGRELMIIKHPAHQGGYADDMTWSPTETAIGPNGDIYIADGYGASYICQYTADGEFIRKFGGKEDGDYQLITAHGVCIDDRDKNNPTLLVTSRARNLFKRFTLDGQYLETIHLPGAYVCRPVIDGDNLYAGVCWSSEILFEIGNGKTHPTQTNPYSGFVTILDKDNKVVSNPGGTKPKYKRGKLQTMLQAEPIFKHCHDVCIDEDKNIYVCQWNAGQTYPVKLERV